MSGQVSFFHLLPHRPPFLWVDRIIELKPGKEVVALKRVSAGEEVLVHGPLLGNGFPFSLIAESMAQAASLAASSAPEEERPSSGAYASIKEMQILREPKAGEELWLRMTLLRQYGRLFEFYGEARIEEELVAWGQLVFHLY